MTEEEFWGRPLNTKKENTNGNYRDPRDRSDRGGDSRSGPPGVNYASLR